MAEVASWGRMTRDNAKKISDLMIRIGRDVDEILAEVRATEPASEARRVVNMLSHVLASALTEVMNPIYAEHPELRPRELRD